MKRRCSDLSRRAGVSGWDGIHQGQKGGGARSAEAWIKICGLGDLALAGMRGVVWAGGVGSAGKGTWRT